MITPFELTVKHITPQPTLLWGLKYFPSLEPHCSNDHDAPFWGWPDGPEVSDCNLGIVSDTLKQMGPHCQSILEIGIHRNDGRSMTNILMDNRPEGSIYLGVDLDDKSYLDDPTKNLHTIKSNSHDQLAVRQKLAMIGIKSIDLLFIDGWHSVNTTVNDWMYTDLLSPFGVVILHDTNAHPGCVALFEAVDENLFFKERYCTEKDMGIAVFRRK
jgi:hypothetical protein